MIPLPPFTSARMFLRRIRLSLERLRRIKTFAYFKCTIISAAWKDRILAGIQSHVKRQNGGAQATLFRLELNIVICTLVATVAS